jgi:hypothetical protein
MNVVRLGIQDIGIGPPPERLPPDVREAWDAVVTASPPNILMPLHRLYIELVAYSLARWRDRGNLLCETERFATRRLLCKMMVEDCLIPEQDAERLLNAELKL